MKRPDFSKIKLDFNLTEQEAEQQSWQSPEQIEIKSRFSKEDIEGIILIFCHHTVA